MLKTKHLLPLLLLPLLLAGCASTVTNLTTRQLPRNPSGLYPVEARWDSNQQSLRRDSIKAYVVVGLESYPMQRTQLTVNRWEAVVPVPKSQRFLNYRFKFDYLYNAVPAPRADSKLSAPLELEIVDK